SGIAVCPQPVSVTAEGANQIVSATAVDKAGNTVSLQVTLNIDKTAPLLVSTASPDANARGWNNTPVAVTFAATDALSGVVPTSLSMPVILTADGTNLSATGQATDLAGNTGSITRGGIRIDQVKPVLPAAGTTLFTPSVLVQGTVTEDGSGIVSVTCNNAPATTAAGNVECSATLTPGANSISLESTDMAGNTSADAVSLIYARVPKVTI